MVELPVQSIFQKILTSLIVVKLTKTDEEYQQRLRWLAEQLRLLMGTLNPDLDYMMLIVPKVSSNIEQSLTITGNCCPRCMSESFAEMLEENNIAHLEDSEGKPQRLM